VVAGAAASAVALALYARVTWPWLVLGWIGLVPWLAALDRTASVGAAVGTALVMCAAFVLTVFGWFAEGIRTYTGAPWPAVLLVVLLLAPLLEPQFVTFALARHLARRRGFSPVRVALAGACVYVGTEWAFPKLFADTLGHGLYASAWMRQAADLAGAHGLTFVLVLANECALAAARRRALVPALCVAASVVALLGYGAARYRQLAAAPAGRGVAVGIVQADIDQYERLAAENGTFEAVRRILAAHFALSEQALGRPVDLLVWPETVYPTTFGSPKSVDGAAFDREIAGFVEHSRVPLIFGAYDAEDGDEFNAAVFLEPSAGSTLAFETYRKATLFPLTERVPAALDTGVVRGWLPWMGTWKAGPGPRVVPLALHDGRVLRIAPLICYDAVDPGFALAAVRRGADLIVTLSNDSWLPAGARLHLVVSAFRSVETRRPQVRATNTGISAVITATGDVVATAGVHEAAALVATVVPDGRTTTLMLAWGDWFPPTALAAGALLLLAPRRGRSVPGHHGRC
jgi:apolipoprotein N-acyltransferase